MKLLVPSVGKKSDLVRLLSDALERRGGRLLVSDIRRDAPALAAGGSPITLPRFGTPAFWSVLDDAIVREAVDAVLPVRDVELAGWAERAENGRLAARTLLSSAATLRVCHDKARLYEVATAAGVACPPWQHLERTTGDALVAGPAIVKPLHGSGSRGIVRLGDGRGWHAELCDDSAGRLIQEFVAGAEFSVDCFAERDGRLAACCVREREIVQQGQSVAGRILDDPYLVGQCERLAEVLSFRGIINFQFVRDARGAWLIDVNPRFPGGIAQTVAAGYPFVEWTLDALQA
ncbi:MAG: ATP-grasp domain-containing protein [Gammaproteobacteria bacterium]|nr:ATP-grasp domain-containing protein [Gammaproteobacteria bacterium]